MASSRPRAGGGTVLAMRARGAVVAMVLLLVLGGCSSGSGDDTQPSTTTTTTTGLRLTGPGSLEEPIAINTAADVSEQWKVKVLSTVPDATSKLRESRPDATPPEGRQFFLATVELTYLGGGVASPQYSLTFSALDGAGTFYTGSADCGALPEPVPAADVVTGTTSKGDVCWVVPNDQAASLVMVAEAGLLRSGRMHFALR